MKIRSGVARDGVFELLFEIGSCGALFGCGVRGLVAALVSSGELPV